MSDKPDSSQSRSPDSIDPVAVALRYRRSQDAAPTVVAAGRGEVARRIVAAAEAHGVPVCRETELAEALSVVELGDQIPLEAFAAVAEIIAYLIRLDGSLASCDAASGPDEPEDCR